MEPQIVLQVIISGLLVGGAYGTMATGMNLIWGVMKLTNTAHGEFLMLGAFTFYWLNVYFHIDQLTSLAAIFPIFFLLGLIIFRMTVPRLLKSHDPEMYSFLVYYGLSMIVFGTAFEAWGSDVRGIEYPYGERSFSFTLGSIAFYLSSGRLTASTISMCLMLILFVFLYKTYFGKAVRAIIQDRDEAQISGINVGRVSAITFALAIALVAISGPIISLAYPSIYPGMGWSWTLFAFVIIILGGVGHPVAPLLGGVVYGLFEGISALLLTAGMAPASAFALIVLVLSFKPTGLMGRKEKE